jgi:hypothetical protein
MTPKRIVPVRGTSFQMVQILANAIATVSQFHNVYTSGIGIHGTHFQRVRLFSKPE